MASAPAPRDVEKPESLATLSRDLVVGAVVYEAERRGLGPVYLSRLADAYEEPVEDGAGEEFKLSESDIDTAHDMLEGGRELTVAMETLSDGRSVPSWQISPHAAGLYDRVVEDYPDGIDAMMDRLEEEPA